MSIKSELKDKLKKAREHQKEQERELEFEARKMIEEFIIPKFREIAESKPTLSCLSIKFSDNIGGCFYSSNIDSDKTKSTYDGLIIEKAVQIANDFEIEAKSIADGAGGTIYTFTLDLDL